MNKKSGFTLIELLVIIIIMGLMAALISGNIVNSLQKGRDSRRKNDLAQLQRALEMYYEDYKTYPAVMPTPGNKFCQTVNCFANEKVYMVRMPADPNSDNRYTYLPDATNGQYYYLFSCIENYVNDQGSGVSSTGYCSGPPPTACGTAPTCGACGSCKYVLGSPNALPISPHP